MAQNVTAPDLAQSSAHARPRRLEGRVCLITGAGGAIGLDTARVFLLEGAKVALVDINQSALDAAVSQLASLVPSSESTGSWVLPICADITVEATVEAYTKQTVDAFGRLDVVFLNAGLSYSSTPLFDTTEELFDRLMKVNVKSVFFGLKVSGRVMKELGNGGSIIVTSSIAGLRGTPGLILYSGTKYALRGFAQTAASELGPYGIRVNTLHPSGIDSPMFRNAWSDEKMKQLLGGMPLGRFANVDDVSSVVAFLASDDSKFMTGGFLKVDGGCINF